MDGSMGAGWRRFAGRDAMHILVSSHFAPFRITCRLESDVATLQQHLATMRATYQLNTEKLAYNYRVLLERDSENAATINQQVQQAKPSQDRPGQALHMHGSRRERRQSEMGIAAHS